MLSQYGYSGSRYYKYQAYATNFNLNIPGINFKRGEINVSKGGKNVQIKDGKVYINGKLMTGGSGSSSKKSVCRNKTCRNGKCTESSCRGSSSNKAKAKVKDIASGLGLGAGHDVNDKEPAPAGAMGDDKEPDAGVETPSTGTGDPIADFFAWIQSILDRIFGGLGL